MMNLLKIEQMFFIDGEIHKIIQTLTLIFTLHDGKFLELISWILIKSVVAIASLFSHIILLYTPQSRSRNVKCWVAWKMQKLWLEKCWLLSDDVGHDLHIFSIRIDKARLLIKRYDLCEKMLVIRKKIFWF